MDMIITYFFDHSTLADVVKMLRRQVKAGDLFDMIVRRGYVLEDALRRAGRPSFDPARSIVVCFIIHSYTFVRFNDLGQHQHLSLLYAPCRLNS